MTDTATPVPPLRAVQAALRKTTELLASELARPTAVVPDWTESEWLIARAAATMHGVSPLLSRALLWQGPSEWTQFLREQRAHTAHRHARIQQLLKFMDERAREDGIALVALKGAALHAMGLYEPGERPMADIDLLARKEDMDRTARMIEALGFHQTLVTWKHRVFEPNESGAPASFGEHSNNVVKIELHDAIRERLPQHLEDVTQLVLPREPHPGLNDYPSKAALLSHLLLHAAGCMVFRSLRILHVHDISRLSTCMTDTDWDEFLAPARTPEGMWWWVFPSLALTARYGSSIPQRVLVAAAKVCPWRLRWVCDRRNLSDYSHSYLWVDAFPGIEWARSVGEILTHARQRVVPTAEMHALRKYIATTHPDPTVRAWVAMSYSRRVLRWAKARTPRAETMFAVRTALAQTDSS